AAAASADDALEQFIARRRPRTDWVQRESRAIGDMLRAPAALRDAALREHGAARFRARFAPLVAPPSRASNGASAAPDERLPGTGRGGGAVARRTPRPVGRARHGRAFALLTARFPRRRERDAHRRVRQLHPGPTRAATLARSRTFAGGHVTCGLLRSSVSCSSFWA